MAHLVAVGLKCDRAWVGTINFSQPGSWRGVFVDAHSGPSGETASGTLVYDFCGFIQLSAYCYQGGDVTCLNVTGNRAVVGYYGAIIFPSGVKLRLRGLVEIEDNGSPGAGRDTLQIETHFIFLGGPSPDPDVPFTSCPATLPGQGTPLTSGDTSPFNLPQDYVVIDAKPLPTSKDQCKNGGWHDFGVFTNQGDCVSFVATRGKNPPGKPG
jgi:hypothetical protein